MNYPISEAIGLSSPLLSEISPTDYKFSVLKRRANVIALMFETASIWHPNSNVQPIFEKYSHKISHCSQTLNFRLTDEGLKLSKTIFCRTRLCPICVWRKSLGWFAKAQVAFPEISKFRLIFLTLTVRNCKIWDLRETCKKFSANFLLFIKAIQYRLKSSFKGYLRSFECTRENSNYAHPHYHVVLAVDESYFSDFYLPFEEWRELWIRCTDGWGSSIRINAVPINISSKDKTFLELLKYELKPEDFKRDWKWLADYSLQVKGVQKFSSSGVFRKFFRFLDNENLNQDFIHYKNEEEILFDSPSGKEYQDFIWCPSTRHYVLYQK